MEIDVNLLCENWLHLKISICHLPFSLPPPQDLPLRSWQLNLASKWANFKIKINNCRRAFCFLNIRYSVKQQVKSFISTKNYMQHHLTILVSKLTAHYTAAATPEDMTKRKKNIVQSRWKILRFKSMIFIPSRSMLY